MILVGNASSAAKIQKSEKGDVSFMTFSMGVKNGKNRTSFFPVVVFDNLGNSLVTYVTRDRQIVVEERIEVSDSDRFNIVADKVVLGLLPKEPKLADKTRKNK